MIDRERDRGPEPGEILDMLQLVEKTREYPNLKPIHDKAMNALNEYAAALAERQAQKNRRVPSEPEEPADPNKPSITPQPRAIPSGEPNRLPGVGSASRVPETGGTVERRS